MAEANIKVCSQRFGDIAVPGDKVFEFTDGLVGLPGCRRFVIMDHQASSPFKWMVCLDNPDLGFAVVNPEDFIPDYKLSLDGAAQELDIKDGNDVAVFTIVTIPTDPSKMTIDLMAPVVVNLRTRKAKQLVMEDSAYSASYPLLSCPV